jgi:hypothetical protein
MLEVFRDGIDAVNLYLFGKDGWITLPVGSKLKYAGKRDEYYTYVTYKSEIYRINSKFVKVI